MMIFGFGPDAAVVVVVLLPPPPPPQAVRPIRSATPKEIANAALAARRVCLRNIRCPPSLALPLSGPVLRETLRSRSHPARRGARHERQDKCGRQRHRRDAQRGGEHAGFVVYGQIGHDLAEAAAS